ncbi:MAG: flagellar biosynthetic protein FliO [Gammaproteobacteria bacterium]
MNSLLMAVAASAAGEQSVSAMGASAMLEMLLWLVVVIGFILACAWAYKRLNGGMLAPMGVIKVRSVISVGNREKIALVEVGETQLLVGVTSSQINTLHVFDKPAIELSTNLDKNNNTQSEFAVKLQGFLNKDQKK